MSVDRVRYFDSSALVKLVREEPETAAVRALVDRSSVRYASALVRAEVPRALRRHGPRATARAQLLVEELDLIAIDDVLLDEAALVAGAALPTLDAIHLASALALRDDLEGFVTYDARLAAAAEAEGFRVESPR